MENILIKPVAPAPAPESVINVEHSQERICAYPWLTDQELGLRLTQHVKDENKFTDESFKQLGIDGIAQEICDEMTSRLTDYQSSIVVDGAWSYYTSATKEDTAQSHWRFPTYGDQSNCQLLFNETEEAKQRGGQLTLGSLDVSDDGELLLVSFDTTGEENYTLQVRRILDGTILCEVNDIAADEYSGVQPLFNSQGDGIYFIRHDENQRNASLSYRTFDRAHGGFTSEEVCIYNELDERFWISTAVSRDLKWLLISAGTSNASEVFIMDRNDPASRLISFAGRHSTLNYELDIYQDAAYVITDLVRTDNEVVKGGGEYNFYAVDFLFDAGLAQLTSVSSWRPSLQLPPRTVLEKFDIFDTFTAFEVRLNGLQRVMVSPRDELGIHHYPSLVGNPNPVSAQVLGENPKTNSKSFIIHEKGMQPEHTFRVTLDSKYSNTTKLIHSFRYPGLKEEDYSGEVAYATAPDGELIPFVIFTPRNIPVIGTLLSVYGAYGLSDEIDYVSSWHSLLNRGVACAVAYSRGGGELGQAWYRAASLDKKAVTMTDTFAVAETIRRTGLAGVDGKNIVLVGGSAGGAAVGGTVNLDPAVFAGVVGIVPFVDCLNTMLDPTLPMTIGEYDDWGNPTDDESAWKTIKSWAPTENIKNDVKYPPILATAGLNDPRVGIWEPARWVLLLRDAGNQAFMRTAEVAGHKGSSNKFSAIKESAERTAFIYWCLTRKKY